MPDDRAVQGPGRRGLADHLPPDLIVFDVDGTLHDTFQWWGPVLRRGLARFAETAGVAIPLPDDRAAAAVVGMRDAGVWAPFLPEKMRHRWPELRAAVLPLEVETVAGRDFLFPGVRELLSHLRGIGVRVALASNCRATYFEAVRRGQGLDELCDFGFCLDSPGVADKADMLRLARQAAGARRPVMVGDREPDRDAARALGWPFVWRANDRCRMADADAVWCGDPARFLGLLGLPPIS